MPPFAARTRRVGRPRENWVKQTVERYWLAASRNSQYLLFNFDWHNQRHVEFVPHHASGGQYVPYSDSPPHDWIP